jgi:tetratricopeptide (TPR) repeat protein
LALYKIIILLLVSSLTFSQVHPDKNVDKLIRNGIENLVKHNYEKALGNFKVLTKEHSRLPLGDIFTAAVFIAEANDYGEKADIDTISKLISHADEKVKILYEAAPDDLWNNYYYAMVKGYSAYFEALNDNYLSAFAEGLSSISYFEKCIEKDSSFYEAYLALGIYKYWRSEKTASLSWLPFIEDEREIGIKYLKFALKHECYNSYLGINSLLWIYINQKEYGRAVKVVENSGNKYRDCRFLKWALADAYQRIDEKKAISIYYELLNFYMNLPGQNHLNEIILKHKIAMLYEQCGESKKALKLCDEILGLKSLNEYVKENLKDRLERIASLKSKLGNSQ